MNMHVCYVTNFRGFFLGRGGGERDSFLKNPAASAVYLIFVVLLIEQVHSAMFANILYTDWTPRVHCLVTDPLLE